MNPDDRDTHATRIPAPELAHDPAGPADPERRNLTLALLGLLGGGLLAEEAAALPLTAPLDFTTVNLLLKKYGLSLNGKADRSTSRDVLTLKAAPVYRTQYDFEVREMNGAGVVAPSYRTSVYEGRADFIHFDPDSVMGLEPCIRVAVDHGGLETYEHFAPATGAGTHERLRVEVQPGRSSFEFDWTIAAGGDMCIRTVVEAQQQSVELRQGPLQQGLPPLPFAWMIAERNGDGSLRTLMLATEDTHLPLRVRVGNRRYDLVNGELVPFAA